MATTPYGSWPSIVTPATVTTGTVNLSEPRLDGDTLYWLEGRPDEGGRVGLWRRAGDHAPELVVPAPYNVRSRVHEYGGGAYSARDGVVVFSNLADNRVYRVRDGQISAITEDSTQRYADLRVHPELGVVLAVREGHSGDGEPVNTLVALDLEGVGAGAVLVAGADFYSTPELSVAGDLAWVEWDHPNMPWDATRLRRGHLTGTTLTEVVDIAGGPEESAVQPRWSPSGTLTFVSDRTGWWNLYRFVAGTPQPIWSDDADYADPQWVFGRQTYAFVGDDRVLTLRIGPDGRGLVLLDTLDTAAPACRTVLESGAEGSVTTASGRAAAMVESPERPTRVALLDLEAETWTDVRRASEDELPRAWVSVPRAVTWPSPVDDVPGKVHGWYYPPTNPTVTGPEGELPPLVVHSHGGPTSAARLGFDPSLQYWTSRGFAVLDVDYRGSTGHGRAYRDALRGAWGVLDVADCAAGASAMATQGLADPARLVVQGGSAGGYTTLRALTTTDVFTAGISAYGIGDLETLARDTHKFEARYLDRLVGPYPQGAALYRERSPINHLDRLAVPILLLQGADDMVVPLNQAEAMADAVRARGLPVALIVFEGEGHGFRRAETIRAALEAELYFLGQAFGFTPADDLPAIAIENL